MSRRLCSVVWLVFILSVSESSLAQGELEFLHFIIDTNPQKYLLTSIVQSEDEKDVTLEIGPIYISPRKTFSRKDEPEDIASNTDEETNDQEGAYEQLQKPGKHTSEQELYGTGDLDDYNQYTLSIRVPKKSGNIILSGSIKASLFDFENNDSPVATLRLTSAQMAFSDFFEDNKPILNIYNIFIDLVDIIHNPEGKKVKERKFSIKTDLDKNAFRLNNTLVFRAEKLFRDYCPTIDWGTPPPFDPEFQQVADSKSKKKLRGIESFHLYLQWEECSRTEKTKSLITTSIKSKIQVFHDTNRPSLGYIIGPFFINGFGDEIFINDRNAPLKGGFYAIHFNRSKNRIILTLFQVNNIRYAIDLNLFDPHQREYIIKISIPCFQKKRHKQPPEKATVYRSDASEYPMRIQGTPSNDAHLEKDITDFNVPEMINTLVNLAIRKSNQEDGEAFDVSLISKQEKKRWESEHPLNIMYSKSSRTFDHATNTFLVRHPLFSIIHAAHFENKYGVWSLPESRLKQIKWPKESWGLSTATQLRIIGKKLTRKVPAISNPFSTKASRPPSTMEDQSESEGESSDLEETAEPQEAIGQAPVVSDKSEPPKKSFKWGPLLQKLQRNKAKSPKQDTLPLEMGMKIHNQPEVQAEGSSENSTEKNQSAPAAETEQTASWLWPFGWVKQHTYDWWYSSEEKTKERFVARPIISMKTLQEDNEIEESETIREYKQSLKDFFSPKPKAVPDVISITMPEDPNTVEILREKEHGKPLSQRFKESDIGKKVVSLIKRPKSKQKDKTEISAADSHSGKENPLSPMAEKPCETENMDLSVYANSSEENSNVNEIQTANLAPKVNIFTGQPMVQNPPPDLSQHDAPPSPQNLDMGIETPPSPVDKITQDLEQIDITSGNSSSDEQFPLEPTVIIEYPSPPEQSDDDDYQPSRASEAFKDFAHKPPLMLERKDKTIESAAAATDVPPVSIELRPVSPQDKIAPTITPAQTISRSVSLPSSQPPLASRPTTPLRRTQSDGKLFETKIKLVDFLKNSPAQETQSSKREERNETEEERALTKDQTQTEDQLAQPYKNAAFSLLKGAAKAGALCYLGFEAWKLYCEVRVAIEDDAPSDVPFFPQLPLNQSPGTCAPLFKP